MNKKGNKTLINSKLIRSIFFFAILLIISLACMSCGSTGGNGGGASSVGSGSSSASESSSTNGSSVITPSSDKSDIKSVSLPSTLTTNAGASFSELGLPSNVAITLDNDTISIAMVTWDEPTYSTLSDGTYTLTGIIKNPNNVTNSKNIKAEIQLTVLPINITSVEPIHDIKVPIGTSKNTFTFPQSVSITLDNNKTSTADVTWDLGNPKYEAEVPGVYVFTGNLSCPKGIINGNNLHAKLKVEVYNVTRNIVQVEEISDRTAEFGTAPNNLNLPSTVTVLLDGFPNGNIPFSPKVEQKIPAIDSSVTWDTSSYKADIPGTYTLKGTITNNFGITNTNNLIAQIKVTVKPAPKNITSVSKLKASEVPFKTAMASLTLPPSISVTLDDGSEQTVNVNWDLVNCNYDGNVADTYTILGNLSCPDGITNSLNLVSKFLVKVLEPLPNIIAIKQPDDEKVFVRTPLSLIALPSTVTVTLNKKLNSNLLFDNTIISNRIIIGGKKANATTMDVNVSWDTSSYDETSIGTYILTGTIELPIYITNTNNLKTEIKIIVQNPPPKNIISIGAFKKLTVPFGIDKNSLTLPTSVSVTFDDNSTRTLYFAWNLDKSNYNAYVPGTYTLKADMKYTTDIVNTNAIQPEIQVEVLKPVPNIIAAEKLNDITVPFGTPLLSLNLPSTVNVTLDDGSDTNNINNNSAENPQTSKPKTVSAKVTWDTSSYIQSLNPIYTITGTITNPDNVTNTNNIKAEIRVIFQFIIPDDKDSRSGGSASAPIPQTITSIGALQNLEYTVGTALKDLNLPATVTVTLNNDTTTAAQVTWDTSTYNPSLAGTYTLTGTITNPDNVTNNKNLKAEIKVTVLPIFKPTLRNITSVDEFKSLTVIIGTTGSAISLPQTAGVTLDAKTTTLVTVNWDSGTPKYNATVPGIYIFYGNIVCPSGVTNNDKLYAKIKVTVMYPNHNIGFQQFEDEVKQGPS